MKMNIILLLMFMIYSNSFAKWTVEKNHDEMTGKTSAYATSSYGKPTKKMDFPYSKTLGWIGVGCNAKSKWVYVGFNTQPNISNSKTQDGYNDIRTRIKFGEEVFTTSMTQDWGAKFIHFDDDNKIIENLKKHSTMLLELDWYGNGSTYFKFSLSGSTRAINKALTMCGIKQKEDLERIKKLENNKLKDECIKNGGFSGWDYKKDRFKCIPK